MGEQILQPAVPNPIRLSNMSLVGFALQNAEAGKSVETLVRASLISDQPEFHVYMRQIQSLLSARLRSADKHVFFNSANSFLLLIHSDNTAHLYVPSPPLIAEIRAKRAIEAGQIITTGDIADVCRLQISGIDINSDDRIALCFKVHWKFGLFFSLEPNTQLDLNATELELGHIWRYLQFQNLYDALSDRILFERLTKAGWFPFIEIMGAEFESLQRAYQEDFGIEGQEAALIGNFDNARIDAIAARWWKSPTIAERRTVLEPALKAFKNNDPVSSIKNLLTEIEGIIRSAMIAETGSSAKTKKLLEFAIEKGISKAGTDLSLFFPKQFLQYLKDYTYANFNPLKPDTKTISRHSIAHGSAPGEVYTAKSALQAILTLDQIAFFL